MLKSKVQLFLAATFLLLVWACGGPNYFDLHLENPENPGGLKLDKVLLIEDVEINQTYQDQRIVYRESPFQVKYYNFMLWSKPPNDLIEDAVVDFWRKRSVFKKVNVYGSGEDADLTMRIKIDAIEKYYFQKNWYARLAMDMEIVDVESRETVLRHSFDQKMILKVKKVRALPEKISEILHNELLKIEAKLQRGNTGPSENQG
ncbi:MAG: ABC-type transport auxiliary lipoprotein family protein [Candidatus Aminicenantes bacterium]|nr:membrane integrity-associated transporter subunit PqiC [Acidobacteriota bacterium]MCG2810984.1 ABC-type transport auxiliary lipoprotein family protein [Candidatus Aminicenantes bacterium]